MDFFKRSHSVKDASREVDLGLPNDFCLDCADLLGVVLNIFLGYYSLKWYYNSDGKIGNYENYVKLI